MDNYMGFLNSPIFWVVSAPLVLWVIFQSVLYIRLSFKQAEIIKYPKKNLYAAIKNGAITTVGPSVSLFVMIITMMTIFGGPLTWNRLLIIGAPPTELTAATVAAESLGQALEPGMDASTLFFVLSIMAINACGWLVVSIILTPRIEQARLKVSGGDMAWLTILSTAASLGLTGLLWSSHMFRGTNYVAAAVVGFLAQFLLDKFVAPKLPWIRSYILTVSILLGITAGAVASHLAEYTYNL
ncbi:MAG: DUF5058 family protein [Firmicutes bacterium]|nr:DUF5058 family protein [Bacillota bacterium]